MTIFRKPVQKIQVWLKSDKTAGAEHERQCKHDNISMDSSENERYFGEKFNNFYFWNFFFLSLETHAGDEVMWKNALELDGLQMAI